MSNWLIVPHDPLIFRDGKPFTTVPGERSISMVFPYPSTVAGAIRTQVGTDPGSWKFDSSRIDELLRLTIRGPLLVELDESDQIKDWLFPAPADALLISTDSKGQAFRNWLAPGELPDGCQSDVDRLNLVGPSEHVKEKHHLEPPRYWYQEEYLKWLESPQDGLVTLDELGIRGPQYESRTHVSIDPGTQTAIPGALFQTSGLEFIQLKQEANEILKLQKARTLALSIETEADLREGIDVLGGKRRVVRWQKTQKPLPACPESIKEKIIKQKHCRMLLLTPAKFDAGFLPTWFLKEHNLSVQAVALQRYQTISGWDYEKTKPKPTYRLVPAGSIYYLKFGEQTEVDKFINAVWMQTISDEEQARRDGFGMAVLGTWSGDLRNMEVQS